MNRGPFGSRGTLGRETYHAVGFQPLYAGGDDLLHLDQRVTIHRDDSVALQIFHASKSHVRSTCFDITFASRADHVPGAIFAAAQERTTSVDAFDNSRFFGIPAANRTFWVFDNLA